MSTPADKIKYLNETKAAIKEAIEAKGVVVADDATFRSYADSIEAITGPLPQQEKSIEITANGSYEVTPDEGFVISKAVATVNVPIPEPVIEALEITENGTYEAAAGIDGYSPITVNVPTGGGGGAEVEPIVLTGDCQYVCGGDIASNYIKLFGDTITTSGITNPSYMFYGYKNATVPFEINMNNSTDSSMSQMFYTATNLEVLPRIINAYPSNLSNILSNCYSLRNIPEDWMDTWNFNKMYSSSSASLGSFFIACYSLRTIPVSILSKLHNEKATNVSRKIYNGSFSDCYSLDEIVGLPVDGATLTANAFGYSFALTRAKNLIFETNEDGSVKTANWKNQTIDMSSRFGYTFNQYSIFGFNSGITEDKWVTDDATYQALKDDPDWFSTNASYSRYNHDGAVATINSLPDTSAYLATAGGTNTIKFEGACGSATDGGAINTLTEEEIAVATAKGWTVTLV